MTYSIDQILPSLQSFGVLGYWLIGLASLLEAFFLSGVIIPGTLIVDAGGVLVQRGLLDFFDLAWFVAIGSVIGSEMSFWTGRLAMNRIPGRRHIESSKTFARAQSLFKRRGGLAIVMGRFMGPVAGLVPLAAAMAGMERRKFLVWNIVGSVPYALFHLSAGYVLGHVMGRIGGSLTRVAVLAVVVVVLVSLLWGLLYSALRLLPLAGTILAVAARNLAAFPAIRRWIDAHPGPARWVTARLDTSAFTGLPLSGLVLVFVYVASVWLDTVVDFASGNPLVEIDMRLAELLHHFRAPVPIEIASWVTATGGTKVVALLVAALAVWLLVESRRPLVIGLLVSVLGSSASVTILKHIFQRPRSPLDYFLETSNSFPSGHSAASVSFYGMALYVLWRARRLSAETALLAAGLIAFAIGASRIYLIEHYLSDVLSGWLVGLLWVIVGIAVAEWLTSRQPSPAAVPPLTGRWRIAGLAAVIALAGYAGFTVWHRDQPRNAPVAVADRVLSDPRQLAKVDDFPAVTESLLGSPLRPISLIVLARNEDALAKAVLASGWTVSPSPTPGVVFDALYSAIEGREDPTVETVSHFWRGQPNDMAFVERPADRTLSADQLTHVRSTDQLPHIRFWRSQYVTPDGLRAFAASVGVDEGTEVATGDGAKATEGKAPPDRAAGERLVADLLARGATTLAHITLATKQTPGAAQAASPLSGQGEATVLALP